MESNSDTFAASNLTDGHPFYLRTLIVLMIYVGTLLFSVANSFANLRQVRAQAQTAAFNRSINRYTPVTAPLLVGPQLISATASGKTGFLRVITGRSNTWTITNSNPWIEITPTTGSGSKLLRYRVSPNSDCTSRAGNLSINGRTVRIQQAVAPKNYSLSASKASFTAQAAAGSVALNADCVWTVQTDDDWISTIQPASDKGEGDATIVYAVTANSASSSRTGSIKILDGNSVVRQTLSVTQEGLPPVSFSFSPASVTFPSEGGSNTVQLTTGENVAWTIKASKGITNVFPTNGIGSAEIRYSVLPNVSASILSNSIVVLDENLFLQQIFPIVVAPVPAPPSYSLSSTYLVFTANGGNVSVGLTANSPWTVETDASWISNISPANGSSNAVINYTLAANTTSGSRTGTLRILDGNSVVRQTLQITQSGTAASFNMSSTSANFSANGGTGSVSLTANSSWRILVDVNWITEISPLSGNGNATINYTISSNSNPTARSSSIRILDGNFVVQKTLVITQEGAPENYSLASSTNSPAGYRWSATLGTAGNDVGNAVATDNEGNVLVTGNLDNYLFIEKYSAAGNLIWSKTFYDNYGSGNAVAVDQNDNVIVAGTFYSRLDFGGGSVASIGEYDSFVVKYSADGAHLWSKRFGGSEGDDSINGLAIDSLGNIFVAGTIVGTVALGGNTTYATGPFDNDIVLAKLSADNGAFLWGKRFASTADDNGLSVGVGPQDEVVFTGNFSGLIDFGSGSLTSSGQDIFLATFSSNGIPLWSKRFGGALRDSGNGVAVDTSGNIILTGSFAGTVYFGSGALSSASANYDDIFLAKFANDGAPLWSQNFGGNLSDQGNAVSVDRLGNIALIGTFADAIELGGGVLTSAGGYDIFIAKYSPDGAHVWSNAFGSNAGMDEGGSVTVDAQSNIIGSGRFFGAVDFGGGVQTSAGQSDMFMINLAP